MKKFKEAIEQLKKITQAKDSGDLKRFFAENEANFKTVQESWFQAPDQEDSVDDFGYKEGLVDYINLAISMYAKVIPHKQIKKITLTFSAHWGEDTEPRITVEFDTATCNIVIDELEDSDLSLDRAMKKECICLSEMIWYEYRPTVDETQLKQDMQAVCQALGQLYPSTEVCFEIQGGTH
jgi:hypothetical protein